MTDREKLTDDERERLARMYQTPLGRKALRIIDANEADRAALVKERDEARAALATEQVNRAQALHEGLTEAREVIRLEDEVARLTAERDEMKALADAIESRANTELARLTALDKGLRIELSSRDAEVARLTEALKDAQRKVVLQADAPALVREVTRLTEALALATDRGDDFEAIAECDLKRAEASEQKLAEAAQAAGALALAVDGYKQKLAAANNEIHRLQLVVGEHFEGREAAEQKLAAAERDRNRYEDTAECNLQRALAAEARVRELEKEVAAFEANLVDTQELESDLAQLRERVLHLERVNACWEKHHGHLQWVEATEKAESALSTMRAHVERARDALYDTDVSPKPEWNMAREVNRITVATQILNEALRGPK